MATSPCPREPGSAFALDATVPSQQASPGIDDYSLGRLIRDTPSRCILLLEDIDCAFPSRDEDDDDDPLLDSKGNPVPREPIPPRSQVTLSGLLNVLDSVASEEGRLAFATTNHIEQLDPALIRPGRMDVRVQYGLATSAQIEQMFERFFPYDDEIVPTDDFEPRIGCYFDQKTGERLSASTLSAWAKEFAGQIPAARFSIAQLQGYLLNAKHDPRAAVDGLQAWMEEQERQKKELEALKKKKRREAAARLEAERLLEEREAAAGNASQSAPEEEPVEVQAE